ncbi:hypothetical protein CRUP_006583 [Coryphaenoides rupestris]|nr:hypothetical protein CRUP_006583 [Coryphaenoides rupestris]
MEKFVEEVVKVPFGVKHLDATLCVPTKAEDVSRAVLLTHGAGGDMNYKHLVSVARALASSGALCLRFTCKSLNMPYRVKAYNAVWEYLTTLEKFSIRHIFLGGRSMGSRAAVALARQLSEASAGAGAGLLAGVICLSFPLQRLGQAHAHRQRSKDLLALPEEMPVLIVSGTVDNLCYRALLERVVKNMKAAVDVHWLEGGSHGLAVRGRPEESVFDEVNSRVVTWTTKHGVVAAHEQD